MAFQRIFLSSKRALRCNFSIIISIIIELLHKSKISYLMLAATKTSFANLPSIDFSFLSAYLYFLYSDEDKINKTSLDLLVSFIKFTFGSLKLMPSLSHPAVP